MPEKKFTAWVAVDIHVEQPAADIETERLTVWEAVNKGLASLDVANRLQQAFDAKAFASGVRMTDVRIRVTNIDVDDVDHPKDITTD